MIGVPSTGFIERDWFAYNDYLDRLDQQDDDDADFYIEDLYL